MKKVLIAAVILGLIGGFTYYYFEDLGHSRDFSITSPLPQLLTQVFPRASGNEKI